MYDATTDSIVFYGRDPLTMETVYVGPDSHFYILHHSGTIGRGDLKSPWTPRDASQPGSH